MLDRICAGGPSSHDIRGTLDRVFRNDIHLREPILERVFGSIRWLMVTVPRQGQLPAQKQTLAGALGAWP